MTDDDTPDDPRADEPPPDTPDATNPETTKRARRRKVKTEDEARAFWAAVFADPVGRREMFGILKTANWHETPFGMSPNGSPDPMLSMFKAGEREVAMRLYHSWLRLARDGVSLMLDENDPRFAGDKKKGR